MKDYYYILGVNQNSSIEEIRKAHRKLSMKFHPDKNNGDKFFESRFKEIQEAYEILSDTNKKNQYDNKLGKSKGHNQNYQSNANNYPTGEIVSFESSKKNLVNGEDVIFFWATKNMSKVQLSCFNGYLDTTGKKTLKIRTNESKQIQIELFAIDYNNKTHSKKVFINCIKATSSLPYSYKISNTLQFFFNSFSLKPIIKKFFSFIEYILIILITPLFFMGFIYLLSTVEPYNVNTIASKEVLKVASSIQELAFYVGIFFVCLFILIVTYSKSLSSKELFFSLLLVCVGLYFMFFLDINIIIYLLK